MQKKSHLYEQKAPHAYAAPEAPHAYTQYGVGYFPPKGQGQAQPVHIRPPKQEQYPPKDYFILSLLVTIFCCLPLGVLSLLYSLKARSAVSVDDRPKAIHSAKWAKMLAIWALALGIGLTVLCVGIIAVLASTRCEKSSWSCVELVFSSDE